MMSAHIPHDLRTRVDLGAELLFDLVYGIFVQVLIHGGHRHMSKAESTVVFAYIDMRRGCNKK